MIIDIMENKKFVENTLNNALHVSMSEQNVVK